MKDIFDKKFIVNDDDYSHSDVLEYLENFLNKEYDNEIFKQNIIKLFNNELNILKKDVENFEISLARDYVVDNPYDEDNYIKYRAFFLSNIKKIHEEKELFNLFSEYLNSKDRIHIAEVLMNKDEREYDIILSLINYSNEDFNKGYYRLYEKYLQNDNIPIGDIDIFKLDNDKIKKIIDNASFFYNNVVPTNNIAIKKYNKLKELYDFKDIHFEIYNKDLNGLVRLMSDFNSSKSFKLVCDDFLDIEKVNYPILNKIISLYELREIKSNNCPYKHIAKLLTNYNNNDLRNNGYTFEQFIWFCETDIDINKKQIRINMAFDKDIIDSIIKNNGIKVFVIGLSFYDFDDKKETVNYLNAKYNDEFNGLIKEFIEENNHLGQKKNVLKIVKKIIIK